MAGKLESWGYIPYLPATRQNVSESPRTLKEQPVHTEEELALAKRYPMGYEGARTKKTGYLLAMDFLTATAIRLDI